MNSPIIISFLEHYYSLPFNFRFLPTTLEHWKNNPLMYENLQNIITNYKYLSKNQINFIIKNNNLIKYSPDSAILNEKLEVVKTIQFKFKKVDKLFSKNNLLYFNNKYSNSDEINLSFLYDKTFDMQEIPDYLSHRIVKTNLNFELVNIMNENFNLDGIKYYNDFLDKNINFINKNIKIIWQK